MKKNPENPDSQSGFFNPRVLLAFTLCSVSVFLAALGFAATPTPAGWSLIASPNTSATYGNELNAVTCASASDCWAVGDYRTGSHNYAQTLIEHWNGTSWAIVNSPNATATNNNVLSAVTCASASDCWAVGSYNNGNVAQTLIEQWNGTSWAIVSSPNNGTASGLSGVTCASASECWAVGSYTYSTGPLSSAVGTLIEHWTASSNSWAVFASPNYSNLDSSLVAVACASASECWAIGSAGNSEIIEYWTANSNSWAIVVSPNTNPNFGENTILLKAVTCASASECWAVGYYFDNTAADPVYYEVIERWNGTSWAIAFSSEGALAGVTCASASECWAVGGNIYRWDGSSWTVVSSPSDSITGTHPLNGVTCASASECWVVGYYVPSNVQTLIEEFAPTIPPLTSVVSRITHGGAGTFDINLPLIGTRGVECRSSAFLGAGNYTMVFSFVNNVTNCGTASVGSLSSGPNLNQCTVNLTGVTNQQYVSVTLSNVLDSQNNTGAVSVSMGVLIGDTTADRSVNSADISQTKSQSGHGVTGSNFREDVTADGSINSADISLVKSKSGTALP